MTEPRLTRRARRDLEALPQDVQRAVIETLVKIAGNPRDSGKELVGRLTGLWSARIGNYRVLHTVEGADAAPQLIVRAIRHRGVAYRRREDVPPTTSGE